MVLQEHAMPVLSTHPTEEQPFLTPQEVSDLLQVSVQTVRRWIKEESLPAYKVGPRMWRIRTGDLDEWLERQRSTAAASH
jgi:excisionase family DNA binding protein